MEAYSWIFWIAAMILFGIAEAATVNMVSVWFVGGSLVALICDLLGLGPWVQVFAFLITAGVLLAVLRPFVRKYVSPRKTATNADMAIGQTAYLTETVDNLRGTGTLKLGGKEWSARSLDDTVLEQGTLVTVIKMEGVKLYVEPAQVTAP